MACYRVFLVLCHQIVGGGLKAFWGIRWINNCLKMEKSGLDSPGDLFQAYVCKSWNPLPTSTPPTLSARCTFSDLAISSTYMQHSERSKHIFSFKSTYLQSHISCKSSDLMCFWEAISSYVTLTWTRLHPLEGSRIGFSGSLWEILASCEKTAQSKVGHHHIGLVGSREFGCPSPFAFWNAQCHPQEDAITYPSNNRGVRKRS